MIIIGADFHPEFQQIAFVDTESGEFQEKRLAHREEAEKFYGALGQAKRCVWGRKPAGTAVGSNDCWPSCRLSCGSEMQQRSEPDECASRRRIGKMPS